MRAPLIGARVRATGGLPFAPLSARGTDGSAIGHRASGPAGNGGRFGVRQHQPGSGTLGRNLLSQGNLHQEPVLASGVETCTCPHTRSRWTGWSTSIARRCLRTWAGPGCRGDGHCRTDEAPAAAGARPFQRPSCRGGRRSGSGPPACGPPSITQLPSAVSSALCSGTRRCSARPPGRCRAPVSCPG